MLKSMKIDFDGLRTDEEIETRKRICWEAGVSIIKSNLFAQIENEF